MLKLFLHLVALKDFEVATRGSRSSFRSSAASPSSSSPWQSYLLMVTVLLRAAAARWRFDLGLSAGEEEGLGDRRSCSSSPGWLHVIAQYYRISQVVSGVCGGRVRGEAAGLIGRRDLGQWLLFAVRGVQPLWVGMLPRRVMTSGSGTSALRATDYRFDLILLVFTAFKKKKREKKINCLVKGGVSNRREPKDCCSLLWHKSVLAEVS